MAEDKGSQHDGGQPLPEGNQLKRRVLVGVLCLGYIVLLLYDRSSILIS